MRNKIITYVNNNQSLHTSPEIKYIQTHFYDFNLEQLNATFILLQSMNKTLNYIPKEAYSRPLSRFEMLLESVNK